MRLVFCQRWIIGECSLFLVFDFCEQVMSKAVRLKILPNHIELIHTFFSVKSQKITKGKSTIPVSIVFIK